MNERGFTMVEIIVSVTIVGVLAAITIPALIGSGPFERAGSTAREFTATLHRARSEAIRRNNHVVIEIQGDRYLVFEDAPPCNGVFNAGEGDASITLTQIDPRTTLEAELTETNGNGHAIITYNPSGAVVRTNGSPSWARLHVTDTRNKTRYVWVDFGGAISLEHGEYDNPYEY